MHFFQIPDSRISLLHHIHNGLSQFPNTFTYFIYSIVIFSFSFKEGFVEQHLATKFGVIINAEFNLGVQTSCLPHDTAMEITFVYFHIIAIDFFVSLKPGKLPGNAAFICIFT